MYYTQNAFSSLSERFKTRRFTLKIILLLIISILFYASFILRSSFRVNGELFFTLFDDAMISMRYAFNLAHGYGLVWNPGQAPVEGYTNLLWTLYMSFLHLLPIPVSKISLMVMLSGGMLLIANVSIVKKITRSLGGSDISVLIACAFTALYYPLAYWTLRGMEVGLLTFILDLAVYLTLLIKKRFSYTHIILLAFLLTAGILTRDDFLVPSVIISLFLVWSIPEIHRAKASLALAIPASIFLAHIVFRLFYYGFPFPNTYYLKLGDTPFLERLTAGFEAFFRFTLVHAWPVILIVATYLTRLKATKNRSHFFLFSIFAGQCLYSIYVGGDAWEFMNFSNRYICFSVPCLLILLSLALTEQYKSEDIAMLIKRSSMVITPAAICIGLYFISGYKEQILLSTGNDKQYLFYIGLSFFTILVMTAILILSTKKTYLHRYSYYISITLLFFTFVYMNGYGFSHFILKRGHHVNDDEHYTRLGLKIKQHTDPRAKIAVVCAGCTPYFAQRESIDLLGKSDITIAHLPTNPLVHSFRPGHTKWDYRYSLKYKPDLIVELWKHTEADLKFIESKGYERVGSFWIRNDSTLVDKDAFSKD